MRTLGRIEICRGQEFVKIFKLRTNGGVDPVDLSDADEVKFAFKKEDGSWLVLSSEDESPKVNILDGVLGHVEVLLQEEDTALLKTGDGQNVEFSWEINGQKKLVVLERVMDVVDSQGL